MWFEGVQGMYEWITSIYLKSTKEFKRSHIYLSIAEDNCKAIRQYHYCFICQLK